MADEISIVVRAEDLASNVLLGTVGVLDAFGSVITGIKSAIDLFGMAFNTAVDFIQPFVDSASESEIAIMSLDNVLRSTAGGVGIFQETIGKLSNIDLLDLQNELKKAKDRLGEMKDEFGNAKTYTDAETLAIMVQEEKIASLTAQLERGAEGLTIFRDTTQLSRDALIELSEALQDTTIYSDEMILAAETMLLRFENINSTIFPEALSLTTDLAAALGIDLVAAARMVGMALDDPEQGIGRLNTQYRLFDETQMETIKHMAEMGDIAGAQALIMDALREKVGGAAEAFGETFAGKLEIAKNKIDNLREVIGGPFIEVFKTLLDQFGEFMDSPLITNIENFFTRLAELLAMDITPLAALGITFREFADVAPIFDEIGQGLLLMQSYMVSGNNPLEALKKALEDLAAAHPEGALAGIVIGIQEFIETGETEGWGVAISELLGGILDELDIQEKIEGFIGFMTTAIGNADWTPISNALAGAVSAALIIVFQGLSTVIDAVDWNPIGAAIGRALAEAIRGMVGDEAADAVIDSLAFEFTPDDISYLIGNWFSGLPYSIQRWFDENINSVVIGQAIINGLITGANMMTGGLYTTFTNAINNTILRVKQLLGIASPSSVFAQIGRDIVNGLIGGFEDVWDNLMAVASNALEDFAALFGIDLGTLFGTGTSASGLGTAGGGVAGGTVGEGGTVTNQYYFYGTVYMSGVGPEGTYDCTTSPVVTSTNNTIPTYGY